MKLAVICLYSVAFFLLADFSSPFLWRRRRRRSRSNIRLGRNTNLGLGGLNYRGNQWNTNLRHNPFNSHTSLNSNYRTNHNFRVGHNWQNRQTNLGYTWNFGKRRSIDVQDDALEFLTIEQEPKIFLKKLQLAVNMLIKAYQDTIPELKILSIFPPGDHVTNITVAQEIVCLVKKMQKLFPNSLGNFILKMIKYHGRSYAIGDIRNFYVVAPVQRTEVESKYECEVPKVAASKEIGDAATLWELKKFVTNLITVAMEYQKDLEE